MASPSLVDHLAPHRDHTRIIQVLCLLAGAYLVQAVVRLAWIGDDGFITMRTVENWVDGYGLRWNVADRAQSFTTPLWMFLCALGRVITGELYYTTIALGFGCTAACLWLLHGSARGGLGSLTLMLLALGSSRAFLDYSTSGLENPLSHAMTALFVWFWFRIDDPQQRLRALAYMSGFYACNRMDQSLLVIVPLLAAARQVPLRQAVRILTIGSLPFVAWIAYSTFYFGTPFPTTAYSKAFTHGLPTDRIVGQGMLYYVDVAIRDPSTLLISLLAIATAFRPTHRRSKPLAIGVLIYFAYIVKIGGCFMATRFFTTPLVMCMGILLCNTRTLSVGWRAGIGMLTVAVSLLGGLPQGLIGSGDPRNQQERWGINDVRCMGWPGAGLCSPDRRIPVAGALGMQARLVGIEGTAIDAHGVVGEHGFQAGPNIHVVDFWLCDPVLCRLPAYRTEGRAMHHFDRRVPEGYFEFLATGDDGVCNPHFARFMHAMLEITRDDLWSWHRLQTITAMLTGAYDEEITRFVEEDYFTPPTLKVPASRLDRRVELRPAPLKSFWFDKGVESRVVYEGGLDIEFDQDQQGKVLELVLEGANQYYLEWFDDDGNSLARADCGTTDTIFGGLERVEQPVPDSAQGFRRIRLTCMNRPDHVAAIAALRVLR
jgi:arabinofuranosyltransferase